MKIHAAFLSICFVVITYHPIVTAQEPPKRFAVAETSWTVQPSGTTAALYSVHAVSRMVAWACGTGGIVLRTVNEGATWSPAGALGADTYTIAGLDSSTALVGKSSFSGGAKIWKTTSGGLSWAVKDSFGTSNSNLQMVDQNTGFYIADLTFSGQYIRKTTNGGETWAGLAAFPVAYAIYRMYWFDEIHGWLATNTGFVFRTSNGGATWQNSTTSFTNQYSLYFTTVSAGLVGSDAGAFNGSTDGGAFWTTGLPSVPYPVLSLAGVRGTRQFWAAAGTSVYYTPSIGSPWTSSPANGYSGSQQINWISTFPENGDVFGWAVGNAGLIVHYKRITTGVRQEQVFPDQFSLSQNYPNPFNPVTNFQLSISNRQLTIVKVYDVLGSEVATLMNEIEPPGRYQVTWDASGFGSGMYFVKLISGNSAQTRKILLLK